MTLEITAIVAPLLADSVVPNPRSPRVFAAVDEFVAAVGAAAGCEVRVIEGTLADAPATGYLLAYYPADLDDYPALGSRIISTNADGSSVYADVENHHLVAAIEGNRYFKWQFRREREVGNGVIGRKDLAGAIHATLVGSYTTEHYDTLQSAHYADLPRLLAAYLVAHAAAGHAP